MSEQPLTSPTPTSSDLPAGNPFVKPAPGQILTVEDVLAQAQLPEKVATICLRADLQGDYDVVLGELATLVNPLGEVVVDPEASVADENPEQRAQALAAEAARLRGEMAAHMWRVRFRGMPSEDFAVFNKAHQPKRDGDDRTEYNLRLVAETACDPQITYDQAVALTKKLGNQAMLALINAALDVCYRGGVDAPKLPGFLANLAQS